MMLINSFGQRVRILGMGVTLALVGACSVRTTTETELAYSGTPPASPMQSSSSPPSPDIRQFDFGDFTPPASSCSQKIEVRNGMVRFINEGPISQGTVGAAFINYGDVTGDRKEEALVVVAVETAGSATPYCLYVYGAHEKKPKLIWSLLTGDRADNGLRQVYTSSQQLILELYSPEDSKGACCPTKFRRITFMWSGNKFQQVGSPDLLVQSSEDGAAPVMPEYSKP